MISVEYHHSLIISFIRHPVKKVYAFEEACSRASIAYNLADSWMRDSFSPSVAFPISMNYVSRRKWCIYKRQLFTFTSFFFSTTIMWVEMQV